MRIMRRAGIVSSLIFGVALVGGHFGCGSNPSTGGGFEPSGTGAGHSNGSANGGNGNGGSPGVGGGAFTGNPTQSTSTGLTPDAACATSSTKATLVPLNMYIMFDKSGSMGMGSGKWEAAGAALTAFFQDPASAGLGVALRFFPDGNCTDDKGKCDVNDCATPLVPMGRLVAATGAADAQETALITAYNSKMPGGGTPMGAALSGAVQFASTYQTAHPTEKTIVVLVTDGDPNGCGALSDVEAAAAAGLQSGILTFTIGMKGSTKSSLDDIAAAGGTMASLDGSDEAALQASFQKIRGMEISCSFPMPMTDDMGKKVDPDKVNVTYTPGDGGKTETLTEVDDMSKCNGKDGWYYDNPKMPTMINLCPATCMKVQADDKAEIDILLGCSSMTGPPK